MEAAVVVLGVMKIYSTCFSMGDEVVVELVHVVVKM
jgi:hypothetical protein